MLKPIHRVPCSPALQACQRMMQQFVVWLCSVNSSADITQQNCAPPRLPSQIEGDWLWAFLLREERPGILLDRAKRIADLPPQDKQALLTWAQTVGSVAHQFQANPPNPWPTHPPLTGTAWADFQTLMQGFYKKGFKSGLPYLPNGTPSPNNGVKFKYFVNEFRNVHRQNPNPEAREVCVFCGGPLGNPEVDHWNAEGPFPPLAICADNLIPVCGDCNSTTNKGKKPVHTAGNFDDWFHPYLRHPNGCIRMSYDLQTRTITAESSTPTDVLKVANLDKQLLKLSERWTREAKAEYSKQQGILLNRERNRVIQGVHRHSQEEVLSFVQQLQTDLPTTEPHYEVHSTLFAALMDQARLDSWQTELGLV